jgi:hypothetical protein
MMKTRLLAGFILSLPLAAAVESRATSERAFDLGKGPRKLIVTNIWGSVHVTGTAGDRLSASIAEHWRADSEQDMRRARQDIALEISQHDGVVEFYVKDPYRCNHDCTHFQGSRGYTARFDFEIRAPRDTELNLSTVAGGDVTVKGTDAAFALRNAGGRIQAQDVVGPGTAETVQGSLQVSFRENPRADCGFRAIAGEITVLLPPGPSADLSIRSVQGGAAVEFPYVALSGDARGATRETSLRLGNGGPRLRLETTRGSIRVSKAFE